MTGSVAPTNRAIVHRREPSDSLDYYPTPPWATRALFHHVLGRKRFLAQTVEDPACGEGHMAYALEDFFGAVRSSDLADRGYGAIRDFLKDEDWTGLDRPDWIVTNPPFGSLTVPFMVGALKRARRGVAMFLRTTQMEGETRWREVFRPFPPAIIAPFVERVPLHKGRWEPDGGTFTAYAWFVWRLPCRPDGPRTVWIPPCRKEMHYSRDVERFGHTIWCPWPRPTRGETA